VLKPCDGISKVYSTLAISKILVRMSETGIKQINLTDVPHLSRSLKYFDGEIGFADDIRSVTSLVDAFKVNFVAMIFCTRGSVSMKVNNVKYDINANDGLLIDMLSVVSDIVYDSAMSCKIICLSLEGGLTFMTKSIFEAFLRIKQNPVVHFSQDEMELMSKYYELAMFKIDHPGVGSTNKDVMHTILRAYIIDMIANKDYSIKLSHDVKYPIIFQIYFNEKDPVTEAYIKKNLMKIFTFVIDASKYTLPDDEKISIIKNLLETGKFFTSRNITRYINIADEKQKFEIFDMLTEYQENLKTNKI
jgi:hypothetical protein